MNRGYAIILNVLILATVSVLVIAGVVNPVLSYLSSSQSFIESKKSFLLANSATEEALYRLKNNKTLTSGNTVALSSGTAVIAVANTASGKDVTITTPSNPYQRNIKLSLALGTGISFHYGIQSGLGGFDLNNSSSVTGNIFSSGQITGSGNYIYGDVISSGPSGLISGIHATGTAYAHTIQNSTIDKDAYYVTKTNTTVTGTSYPNSVDQGVVDLPIDDAQITQWESDAAAGGSVTCVGQTYIISSNTTIGPKKIPCDLEISGSAIVTVAGHLWVTGNITTKNSPTIKIDPSLGNQNVAIIADKTSSRLSSGMIDVGNTTSFLGSGSASSFVFMISQNNSAENGGSNVAIKLSNNSAALVGYASHGLIEISNSVSLKEATAYKIVLKNSANVRYDKGLANSLFKAGPGGGYNILEWREI